MSKPLFNFDQYRGANGKPSGKLVWGNEGSRLQYRLMMTIKIVPNILLNFVFPKYTVQKY